MGILIMQNADDNISSKSKNIMFVLFEVTYCF